MLISFKRLMKQLTTLIVPFFMLTALTGCELALFDSKGPVGEQIGSTMKYTVGLMLIVVIPTIFLSVYVPYRYRSSNKKADYKPEWSHSTLIELIVWGIPVVIVAFLAIETYRTSHSLDPHRPLVSPNNPTEQPLKIQVVALDWKWLFIYPEEGIATVNEISIPVDKPVQFLLTSDAAINSFFIPRLGSQLYAMSGMEGKLNLMATEQGVFEGKSANYSGFGFTGMRFKVLAKDKAGYESWVASVKNSGHSLDDAAYKKLKAKTRDHKVEYFANPNPLRFKDIIEDNIGLNKVKALPHGHDAHGDHDQHGEAKAHGEHDHEHGMMIMSTINMRLGNKQSISNIQIIHVI